MSKTIFIQNEDHYKLVIMKAATVKESLWIGTADIKDLYVGSEPFLGILSDMLKEGREVRLIHAKEPGPIFREEFDRYIKCIPHYDMFRKEWQKDECL